MMSTVKPDVVLWQTDPTDGVAEPALTLKRYTDCIEIRQRDSEILITPESVPELCKALKMLQPEPKKDKA